MVLDSSATPILERFKTAADAEAVAIKALLATLQSGVKDTNTLMALTQTMEVAGNAKMSIYRELEAVRLDK